MAKKEFKSEVVEHIAILKEGERYQKEVLRMIWNDNPITVDIRSVDKQNNFVGKGISLSDEECDKLVDRLINIDDTHCLLLSPESKIESPPLII